MIRSLTALSILLLVTGLTRAQTPEQEKAWEAQRAQAQADAKIRAEKLAQERAVRKADPMSFVRTLDPMTTGGWQFRVVANDGSWAIYSTEHQLKRSGHTVTLWLRQEYPETQHSEAGDAYLSSVQKVQYDCGSERARVLLVIYYSGNNISGSQQTDESDPKQTPWSPIVPGTQSESISQWACNAHK
ncbi:MAG TPA: surface-adhesin E family protein [Steroidobacteraceae bacterium]|jgi:hypothetical protein